MSKWIDYVIELHKDKSGSSWWCQEKIRVPLPEVDADEYSMSEDDIQSMLKDELLPQMIALAEKFFANWDE